MNPKRATISRYILGGSGVFGLTWTSQLPSLTSMADFTDSRRSFLRSCAMGVAGLVVSGAVSRSEGLLAATRLRGPEDPEVPNEEVARILKGLFGDRPIRRGHVSLDMPAVAEDGRVVPVIIESDLPMSKERYVKGVISLSTITPTHISRRFTSRRRWARYRSQRASR